MNQISIPSGTIKSEVVKEVNKLTKISIPSGTIKSTKNDTVYLQSIKISIPSGTIKRGL